MGNAVPRPAAAPAQQAYIDKPERHLIEDLRKMMVLERIGRGRFLKAYHCKEDGAGVCVKVYVKHDAEEDLGDVHRELLRLQRALPRAQCLNALPYARALQGRRPAGRGVTGAAYVVRQHFFSNLLDRLGTRPFLTHVEKQWVVYQLVRAVEQCHTRGVCHGDIKSENVMVTSWAWATLTDFASFKPTYLPDDGPEVDYYFGASGSDARPRCYVAPERFFSSSGSAAAGARRDGARRGPLEKPMDVFALGCVIAEVFNGGTATLDLPTMTRLYRGAGAAVDDGAGISGVASLQDPGLRAAVARMLSADPLKRGEISEHRCAVENCFPAEFDDFVYVFFAEVVTDAHTPDERIWLVCHKYAECMRYMAGVDDAEGAQFFGKMADEQQSDHLCHDRPQKRPADAPLDAGRRRNGDDYDDLLHISTDELIRRTARLLDDDDDAAAAAGNTSLAPQRIKPGASPREAGAEGSSLILMAQLVCCTMRHVRWPRTKLVALALLVRFGAHVDDEARLQRLVPHVVALLDDAAASVRAAATCALASLVSRIRIFASSDASLFSKYIFPSLAALPGDGEEVVVVAFAESVGSFAESARRFLEISLSRKTSEQAADAVDKDSEAARSSNNASPAAAAEAEASSSETQAEYERQLSALRQHVRRWVVLLLSEASSLAKRAVLGELPRLCAFFGREQTQDVLMPHLITFLNDGDWGLRHAFCEHVAAVGAFLGADATDGLILPCVGQALVDTEALVVARALRGLVALADLGLLSRRATLDFCSERVSAAPLLLHPSQSVRFGAAALFAAAAHRLGAADATALLLEPTLARFLDGRSIADVLARAQALSAAGGGGEFEALAEAILESVRAPMSHDAYRSALLDDARPAADDALDAPGAAPLRRGDADAAALMADYLLVASRHARHRRATWQRQQPSRQSAGFLARAPSARSGGDDGDVDGAFGGRRVGGLVEPRKLAEAHAQALVVPDQKFVALVAAVEPAAGGSTSSLASTAAAQTAANFDARPAPVAAGDADPDARLRARYGLLDRRADARSARLDADDLFAGDGAGAEPNDDSPSVYGALRRKAGGTLAPAAARAAGEARAQVDGDDAAYDDAPAGDEARRTPLARRVAALGVPPMPPDLGCLRQPSDGRPFSWYATPLALDAADALRRAEWRPKAGVVVATLAEHGAAVHRLVVAQDQSFFVSASADGTAKVWATRGLDKAVARRSLCTYSAGVAVTDACTVDNSRSVATALASGEVHIWRVELAPSVGGDVDDEAPQGRASLGVSPAGRPQSAAVAASRLALVSRIRPPTDEGAVVAVNHFNTDSSCVVVYGTQRAKLHAHDARMRREAWTVALPPECGLLSSVALGSDRGWICAGTSDGFVALWDARHGALVKLWRHSSRQAIHRLATCARLPLSSADAAPLAFVAAGDNQVAVWDLSAGGDCRQCFRALAPPRRGGAENTAEDRWALPRLDAVAMKPHPRDRLFELAAHVDRLRQPLLAERPEPSVRAIMGRISNHGNSYLITAGTDCHVRYWDFLSPSRCFTVSGPDPGMPRPMYESPRVARAGAASQAADSRLFVCRDNAAPPPEAASPTDVPLLDQRGPVAPPTAHRDAILDLKSIDLPIKMMLSSSRDGVVKCWR